MRVYQGSQDFPKTTNSVVAMGTFDGVHLGHQALIATMRQQAQSLGGDTTLLTFWPHPRLVLSREKSPGVQLLSSLDDKVDLLAAQGVDHLVVMEFTPSLMQMSAQDFVSEILVRHTGARCVIVGYDQRFGRGRVGDKALLQQQGAVHGFSVLEVPPLHIAGTVVGSTAIRAALLAGEVVRASEYLGRSYAMDCTLVLDRTVDGAFWLHPTLDHQLVPAAGHYIVAVAFHEQVHTAKVSITHAGLHDGPRLRLVSDTLPYHTTPHPPVQITFVRRLDA